MKTFYTVPEQDGREVKAGNGSTTVFPFSFVYYTAATIKITLVDANGAESVKTLTTDYTLTGGEVNGEPTAGSVTCVSFTPATGESLVIELIETQEQQTDLINNARFASQNAEKQFDKIVLMVQRLTDLLKRAILAPSTRDPSLDALEVPTPVSGEILVGKSDLSGWESKAIADVSATTLTDPVVIAQGGTGSTTAAAARAALAAAGTGDANTFTKTQTWTKGADVASANALVLGDGNYFDITGTTAITSIGTKGVGTVIKLHFDAALTLTHHATDLIIPGASNITTAAGDEAEFIEYATGDWRLLKYTFAAGPGVAAIASRGLMEAATGGNGSTTTAVPPGRLYYSPQVLKAWARFNGTGTAALDQADNVASLTDNGTGDYTLTWDTDMEDTNYGMVAICDRSLSTVNATEGIQITAIATGSIRFQCVTGAPTATDQEYVTALAVHLTTE